MGIFSKDRHGELKVVTPGYRFVWIVPINTMSFNTVLDSPIQTAFTGVDFHFHLTVALKGEVSFYLHYKGMPIPKYSYWFANDQGTSMRQHTAYRIPEDTERVGHWNMCNIGDIQRLLDVPLLHVHFCFDNDKTEMQTVGDETIMQWTIPETPKQNLLPFTSKGFRINKSVLAIRIDVKNEAYVAFLFARTGVVPPHRLTVSGATGTVLTTQDNRPIGDTPVILRFPLEALAAACAPTGQLVITAAFTPLNPLAALNLAAATATAPVPVMPEEKTDRIALRGERDEQDPSSLYIVLQEYDL